MRFKDPLDIVCGNCSKPQPVSVAHLLAQNAKCAHCDASLSTVGESIHRFMDELDVEFLLIEVVIDLANELSIDVPDKVLEMLVKDVTTKVGFVNGVLPYVEQARPGAADAAKIGTIFDRSMTKMGFSVPPTELTSLFELLGPTRFAERVEHYRPFSRSGRRDT
jgi:hypothetical protein